MASNRFSEFLYVNSDGKIGGDQLSALQKAKYPELANNMASGLQSAVTDKLPGVASDMLSALSPSNLMSAASGMVSGVVDQAAQAAQQLVGQATNVLGSSISDLANSFPSAVKDMFGALNKSVESLGGIVQDIAKAPKEVDSLLKQLGSDAAEALTSPVAFVSKALNDVMTGVSNIVEGSNMMDALGGLASGVVDNLGKSLGTVLSTASEIGNAVNQVTNTLASGITGGINAITNGIGGAINSVVGPITSTVGNFASSLTSGIQSTISGVIGGAGSLLNSVTSSIGGALGSIGSSISETVGGFLKGGSGLLSGITSTIGNVVGGVVGTAEGIIGGVQGLASGVANSLGLGKILDATGLTSSSLTKLPSALLGSLANQAISSVTGAATDWLADKMSSFTNIFGKIGGVGGLTKEQCLSAIMGMGGSYPTQTVNGVPGIDLFGDNTSNDINKMYSAAASICSNISLPINLTNFALNKDLFDILAGLSCDLGLSDLLKQLMNCGNAVQTLADEGEETPEAINYIDNRTIKILSSKSSSVAKKGDINTYNAIQQASGAHNITDPEKDIQTLIANTEGTASQKKAIAETMEGFGMTADDITHTVVGGIKAIKGFATTFMAASGAGIIDDLIGKENRQLTQATVFAYA